MVPFDRSLRDDFAMVAPAGLLANPNVKGFLVGDVVSHREVLCLWAYFFADRMLAQRDVPTT